MRGSLQISKVNGNLGYWRWEQSLETREAEPQEVVESCSSCVASPLRYILSVLHTNTEIHQLKSPILHES